MSTDAARDMAPSDPKHAGRVPRVVRGPGVRGLVSVVIPAYNSAPCVGAALESVFRQTYTPYEVIVVDDGSPDDTEAAVAPWRDRILYVRQPNGGAAVARNTGLARSRGEYIAFLDADDSWMPEKLARQVAYLEAHPEIALVHTDVVVTGEGGTRPGPAKRRLQTTDGPNLPVIFAYCHVTTPAAMVRRGVLERVGGFDPSCSPSEDYDLWIRIAREGGIGLVEEPLTTITLGSRSGWRGDGTRTYGAILRLLQLAAAEDPEFTRRYPELVRERMALAHHELGLALLHRGERGLARRHWTKAIASNPWLLASYPYWGLSLLPGPLVAWLRWAKRGLLPWDPFAKSTSWDSVRVP